jgi:hypothetical protein
MKETEYLTVFDPRGRVEARRIAPASRVAGIAGLRLGILDNTKWNAGRLLRKTASRLSDQFGFAAVNYYRKESFAKAADPALIAATVASTPCLLRLKSTRRIFCLCPPPSPRVVTRP